MISLILYLQNYGNQVGLSLEEQPDMNAIEDYYMVTGGNFWLVVTDDDMVVGTIGLLVKDHVGVKKNSLFTKTFVVVKRVFRPCFTKLWLLTDRQRVSQVLSWTLHLSVMLPTAFMRSKDSSGLKKKNCPFAMTSLIEIL